MQVLREGNGKEESKEKIGAFEGESFQALPLLSPFSLFSTFSFFH
jgi:hypothetical protein